MLSNILKGEKYEKNSFYFTYAKFNIYDIKCQKY